MKKEYNIKRELKRLRSVRGSGTELISLYVPPGTQISDVTSKLRDESGQSSNIKSKTTKLNVQGAIEKIMNYLKLYKQIPHNGLVIFCGNISDVQAKPNIELFSIEPPSPIKVNIYRCDSEFLIEPIESMTEITEMYVIVVMDGREATVGLLRGTHITVVKKIRSFAHAKVRKGGQSAMRYERLIAESIEDYFKRVSDSVNDEFAKHNFKVRGVIVGGPGPTKENFVKSKNLNYQIKVLGVFDTGYTDEYAGFNEILEKSKELIEEQAAVQERKVMERYLSEVAHGGLATSGYANVVKALKGNNVIKLIISEGLELTEVKYRCPSENVEFTAVEEGNTRQIKHSCGGNLEMVSQKDAIEEIIDLADASGVEVVFVSEEGQYGKELMLGFRGIAAMLKYKP